MHDAFAVHCHGTALLTACAVVRVRVRVRVRTRALASQYDHRVQEYVERGSLLDIIVQKPKQLTGKRIKRIAREVALGMTYLHGISPPLIHRDLKSANILVRTHHTRTTRTAHTTHGRVLTVWLGRLTRTGTPRSRTLASRASWCRRR